MTTPDQPVPDEAVTLAAAAIAASPLLDGVDLEYWRSRKAVALVALDAAAPSIRAQAVAADRERLFTAIRHAMPLDAPWRGEALDLIAGAWKETPDA